LNPRQTPAHLYKQQTRRDWYDLRNCLQIDEVMEYALCGQRLVSIRVLAQRE
jgi:hypothetical protein